MAEGDDSRRSSRHRARRTALPDPMEEAGAIPPQPIAPPPLQFHLEQYTKDCYIDTNVMLAHNACVARGHFRDTRGTWVLVHVPTRSLFRLHILDQNAMRICASLSLQGYFELEAWGPDFRRAWEALTSLNDRFRCQITDFEGRIREIHMSMECNRRSIDLQ